MKFLFICAISFTYFAKAVGTMAGETIFLHRMQTSVAGEREVELECKTVEATLKSTNYNALESLEWQKGGAVVANYKKIINSAEWWVSNMRLELDRHRFTLRIHNVQSQDAGRYSCHRSFDSRYAEHMDLSPEVIELGVVDVPSPPGQAMVTSFTSRTATISWSPSLTDVDAPIIMYIIVVTERKQKSQEVKQVNSPGDGTTKVVSGLLPYTQYSFHVMAQNIAGRSLPGRSSENILTAGEAPAAPPTIKYAYNTSNTSIAMMWEHPPVGTLHGPLEGYRIIARPLEAYAMRREFHVYGSITSYEIHGLSVFSKYVISVEASTPFGYSLPDSLAVLTDEGVPTFGPTISQLTAMSSSSIRVTWVKPNRTNGQLIYYTLFYHPSTVTYTSLISKVQVPEVPRTVASYIVENLKPYTNYYFWLTASTKKGEGSAGEKKHTFTDTAAPSLPILSNVSLEGSSYIRVSWLPPQNVHRQVDMYNLMVNRVGSEEQGRFLNTSSTYGLFNDLVPGETYSLSLRAVTNSILVDNQRFVGNFTAPVALMFQVQDIDASRRKYNIHTSLCPRDHSVTSNDAYNIVYCDSALRSGLSGVDPSDSDGGGVNVAVVIAVILVLCLVAAAILVAFILYRRRRKASHPYYLSVDGGYGALPPICIANEPESAAYDDSCDLSAVPVAEFPEYVARLKVDGGLGLSKEYELVDNVSMAAEQYQKMTSEHSNLAENKIKNRYINITGYDHSRVVLQADPDKPGSDYINANFVDGYQKPKAYIATQGPLPNTFADFWQCVWEQRVCVVVMITNLVERGRKKCDQYWPSTQEKPETYGAFHVKLLNEYSTAFYAVRILSVRHTRIKKQAERLVFQFHYMQWPDHGVPDHPLPVLSFIKKSVAANNQGGPIIVHCSAGVGRSGTYIVIESMLRQVKEKGTVSVHSFLRHIRKQRNYLVQTEEQYLFCYDTLLEAIQSGDTEVKAADLQRYVDQTLHQLCLDGSITVLDRQFELIMTESTPQDLDITSAMKACNVDANRSSDYLPAEAYRVRIVARPSDASAQGSDYINASFLPGYHKLREFVVTQVPLETSAFWQMVWDHNCQTIVLLCDVNETDCQRFWPEVDGESMHCGTFLVYMTELLIRDNFTCMDFVLQSTQAMLDDFQLPCRLMHCPNWAVTCSLDTSSVFELVHAVKEWHFEYQNGPMIVVDKCGGTEAATLCALMSLSCQLEQEQSVDVYQTVKLYRMRRLGLFATLDSYHFLYRALRHWTPSKTPSNVVRYAGKRMPSIPQHVGSDEVLLVSSGVPNSTSYPSNLRARTSPTGSSWRSLADNNNEQRVRECTL